MEIPGNGLQGIIGDGLPNGLSSGEYLPVNFHALFNSVCQPKGRIEVRAGGKQPMLCPDCRLIGLPLLAGGSGDVRAAGNHSGAHACAFWKHHRTLRGALTQGTGEIPIRQRQNVGQSDSICGMSHPFPCALC